MIEPTATEITQVLSDAREFLGAWRQNPRTTKTISGVRPAKGETRKVLTTRMLSVLLDAAGGHLAGSAVEGDDLDCPATIIRPLTDRDELDYLGRQAFEQ